ncbi:olfactory receptor 1019-like [Spea bombifrons]|uniref:olfactory receptor 1019-like n=1 Tax=Spea bombifrons TaxID=233779 RepID=UPI00234A852B|nr:olfactory receptor 1019-like [Spea bombifrons]
MENQTVVTDLILSGLSDLPVMELILFLLFLCVYLMTLVVNLLIFLLILLDSHLHSPMYFFLGNLAGLDMCSSSITTPRMLFDLSTKSRVISIRACVTQVYFFIFGVASEIQLLAIMSYDRYVAICHPLHYMQIMHWKTCVLLTGAVWAAASIYSLIHTLFTLRLTFCASNTVHSFFCELPQLFQISCTDTYINVLSVFVLGGLLGLFSLIMTFSPYVCILLTVLKMPAMTKRLKAFSTCGSHLTVVFIFYGTILFNYFRPTTSYYAADKLVSVFYTMINPLLNPIIYSLRNQELKASLRRIVKL